MASPPPDSRPTVWSPESAISSPARLITSVGGQHVNNLHESFASPTSQQRASSQFRMRRAPTFVMASKDYEHTPAGGEPGIAPDATSLEDERLASLHTECQITVVDFSEDQIRKEELWNHELQEFLDRPREEWVKVRWVNCNGLSWDVISALAKQYNFHGLALEDMLSNHQSNRPKCDFYADHAFVVMPLLKLLDSHHLESNGEIKDGIQKKRPFWQQLMFGDKNNRNNNDDLGEDGQEKDAFQTNAELLNKVRTLQRFYGGPNKERVAYMERNSSLVPLNKVVHVEQVSAFLTTDGTVVSFFELSGDDIEPPILARLYTEKTLLRTASDASLMLHAVLDAVVDLAFPVIGAYEDTIAELELTVLTQPSIKISQELYILTSELSLLKSTMAPIAGVLTSLRDHRRSITRNKIMGVECSDVTRTYLADVLDHVLLILDNLDTMKRGADNMIDLIFNTIGSLQNETMKMLTLVTIVFLPLSFMVGYFGMNFTQFPGIENSDTYFWKIAAPVMFVTLSFTLREMLGRNIVKKVQRRAIKVARKRRTKADTERKDA